MSTILHLSFLLMHLFNRNLEKLCSNEQKGIKILEEIFSKSIEPILESRKKELISESCSDSD